MDSFGFVNLISESTWINELIILQVTRLTMFIRQHYFFWTDPDINIGSYNI